MHHDEIFEQFHTMFDKRYQEWVEMIFSALTEALGKQGKLFDIDYYTKI